MLDRIKSTVLPLTIAASVLFFTSTALAVDSPKSATPPGKLKACEARQSAIKTRMNHLTQLANNMISKFDGHAQKVETFYTTKVLPSGKTVANYDSLVSDINTKKATVSAALAKAQTDVNNFSCSSTNPNPKAAMTQFREDMQATKKALKDYRTSIKNLIVAVENVVSKDATESSKDKK